MVNSHCVVFVNNEVVFALEDSEFACVGRQFEHHPFFPRRVNTEFILPFSRDGLRMRVWERARVRHGLRHGSLRRAGRRGADGTDRATGDAGIARAEAGDRMA